VVATSDVEGLSEIVAAQDALLAHLTRSEIAEGIAEVSSRMPLCSRNLLTFVMRD
jgi:hypothetical protein